MADALRVIVLRDGDLFYAQCLEYDIAAQGKTADEAVERLGIALRQERKEAVESGIEIGPAPDHYQKMYDTDIVEKTALVA